MSDEVKPKFPSKATRDEWRRAISSPDGQSPHEWLKLPGQFVQLLDMVDALEGFLKARNDGMFAKFWDRLKNKDRLPSENDARNFAEMVWQDARQVSMFRAFLKIKRARRELISSMDHIEPGTPERSLAAAAINKLGAIMVELGDMP